ncbi:uncharacterized protein LOC124137722 [Haliotis rufescens]|uniref:uncharacterized protein LOC124137722 n=1 Tax=Haliotis rufescens TaxID=6454 RepID=UPI00201F92DF|nr:uncharacterized protein LOC124137722 [Haliotis rufescens]
MLFTCQLVYRSLAYCNVIMFLLVFLLFVTAAVPVDRPETSKGYEDHHFTEFSKNDGETMDENHPFNDRPVGSDVTRSRDGSNLITPGSDMLSLHKGPYENGKEKFNGVIRNNGGRSSSRINPTETLYTSSDHKERPRRNAYIGPTKNVSTQAAEMDVETTTAETSRRKGNTPLASELFQDVNITAIDTGDTLDIYEHIGKLKGAQRLELDPWVFEEEIGMDPDTCFTRLSLTKATIEEYTVQSNDDTRLSSMGISVMDVNYSVPVDSEGTIAERFVESQFMEDDDEADMGSEDATLLTREQEYAAPMLAPPSVDCHFLMPYNRQWIKLVSACPASWNNKTIERLCVPQYETADDNTIDVLNLPVQDQHGMVYRNIFCAKCNQAANTRAWDVVVLCDGVSSFFFIDGNVLMTLMPTLAAARHCRQTLWPQQPDKVETCLMTKQVRNRRRANHRNRQSEETVTYPVSFSVLMNFGFDGKTHILFSTTHEELSTDNMNRCPEPNQVYDSRYDQCREVVCPAGYKLVKEECLRDVNAGPSSSVDGTLPNVQTLTHLPDVAVITLMVNVTRSDLLALLSPDFKSIMIEGMATLLNISSERILNLTINMANTSEPEVAVKTLDEKPVLEPLEKIIGRTLNPDNVSSEEVNGLSQTKEISLDTALPSTATTVLPEIVYTKTDPDPDLPETFSITPEQDGVMLPNTLDAGDAIDRNARKEKEGKSGEQQMQQVPGQMAPPRHAKRHTNPTAQSKVGFDEETITLKLQFLLLPPRSSRLHEGTVSSIKQKMNSLFDQKKFTLSLNGTEVTVVNVVNTANPELTGTFCSRGQMQFYFADQLDVINAVDRSGNNTITHIFVKSTNSIYGPGKFDLTMWIAGNVGSAANLTDIMGYAFVCVMPRISHRGCGRFKISSDKYILLRNKSIILGEGLYNMTEYEYVDEAKGIIEICVPQSILQSQSQNNSYHFVQGCDRGFETFIKAEAYMTAVLGRISIAALAIVLMTYCLFPKLRNLPGVNTMNLTLALLIAESIFITWEGSVDFPIVCSLVAILLHYFFLASFFWMNVMSYDLFRTFGNKTYVLPEIREKSKYLCKYVLYSWGSPAIIVAICVILDFTKVIPGVEIGYGSQGYTEDSSVNITSEDWNSTEDDVQDVESLGCWIQNPFASMTAFGAPIVIIFLMNSCLFVKTILCIRKTAKFTNDHTRRSSVNRRNGRNDVMLYVRMSTVMGFTWIFGLASSIVSAVSTPPTVVACYTEHILGLLFVTFNCSQGLFIFFAFVTKRRVFYLYKGLWVRLKKRIKAIENMRWKRSTSGFKSASSAAASTTTVSTIS